MKTTTLIDKMIREFEKTGEAPTQIEIHPTNFKRLKSENRDNLRLIESPTSGEIVFIGLKVLVKDEIPEDTIVVK